MKSEDLYKTWITTKKRIKVEPDFASKTLHRINRYEENRLFNSTRILGFIASSPLLKGGLVAAAAAMGFFRMVIMILVLFGAD